MARPLRIEFPGAVYHVTSRGDRREPIFVDDEDRRTLLNLVAKLARTPQAWRWSSYRAHAGLQSPPIWLDTDGLHGYLLGRDVVTPADRQRAVKRYAELLATAPRVRLWDSALRQQIYLGDEAFVERMQAIAEPQRSSAREIPKAQRRKTKTLSQWLDSSATREEALYNAHTQSGLSMSAIARQLDLSVSRVSRSIARAEQAKGKT